MIANQNGYSMVNFQTATTKPSPKSGVSKIELTDLLGSTKLRARVWHLEPGDELRYHTHKEQEELYVPLDGPGQLRIDGELIDVEEGCAVCIPPETPRHPVNERDERHVWLIIGAPFAEDDGVPVE